MNFHDLAPTADWSRHALQGSTRSSRLAVADSAVYAGTLEEADPPRGWAKGHPTGQRQEVCFARTTGAQTCAPDA